MTYDQIIQALRSRYEPPAAGVLFEVANATGSVRQRADALAMTFWRSRGYELHGIEIKVSRSDWLRELKNPKKAEFIFSHCDRWWLCVSDAAIVHPGELPVTWGLLAPRGDRLVVKVEAPKQEPLPIGRSFLAAIFRNALSNSPSEKAMAQAFRQGRLEGYEEGKSHSSGMDWEGKYMALRKLVDAFEERAGVTIQWGGAGEIGDAVKALRRGPEFHARKLRELLEQAERATASIRKDVEALTAASNLKDSA